MHEIFLQLTSLTQTPKLSRLLQSPFTLHAGMIERWSARPTMPAPAGLRA